MSLSAQTLINKFNLNTPNLTPLDLTNGRFKVLGVKTPDNKWSPVFIWQMTVAEMEGWGVAGQTVCHNIMLDGDGKPMLADELRRLGMSLRYGWNGSNSDLSAPFEKVWPEPVGNFALGNGGVYWVEIDSPLGLSDQVDGVTLQNPYDVVDPNGHHVTVIVWQFIYVIHAPTVVLPPVTPEIGYATIKRQSIADVLAGIDAQIAALTLARREIAGWLGK